MNCDYAYQQILRRKASHRKLYQVRLLIWILKEAHYLGMHSYVYKKKQWIKVKFTTVEEHFGEACTSVWKYKGVHF